MTVTKDKNFLIIEDKKGQKKKFDFTTGVLFGVSNKELKPNATYLKKALDPAPLGLYHLCDVILKSYSSYGYGYRNFKSALQAAEYFDSIQVLEKFTLSDYDIVGQNFNFFVKAVNNGYLEVMSMYDIIHAFCFIQQNPCLNSLNLKIVKAITECGFISRVIKEPKLIEIINNRFNKVEIELERLCFLVNVTIRTYFLAKEVGEELDKTGNILRQYLDLSKTEFILNQQKKDNNIEQWKAIYKKYSKFKFSNDEFEVIFPEKPQDLITEGMYMHHCVGGYIRSVLAEERLIVFVRQKSNPKQPYITCELRNYQNFGTGNYYEIGQYYKAYDTRVTSQKDIAFKNSYEAYLKTILF